MSLSDPTAQNEQAAFWLAGQMGLPFNHRRYARVVVNGVRRGQQVMEDSQRPNRDSVRQWFPGDPAGDLYKMQIYYEANESGNSIAQAQSSLSDFNIPDAARRRATYRWIWDKRSARGSMNDYDSLEELIRTMNTTATGDYTSQVMALADMEQWMKTMAVERFVGNLDSFGYGIEQNMYFYKPERDRWKLMIWDLDIAFVNGAADPATADLFSHYNKNFPTLTADPTTQRFFSHPPFRRQYLRALRELVQGPVLELNALVDAKYAALTNAGIAVPPPTGLKNYAAARSTFVLNTLARFDPPFAVTSPAADDPVTGADPIVIRGAAPIDMDGLQVNGVRVDLTWATATNWTTRLPLVPGRNAFELTPLDLAGTPLASGRHSLVIQVSPEPPRFSSVTLSGGALHLSWPAVVGRSYGLESATQLTVPDWTVVATLTATTATLEISVPIQPDDRRFFRLRSD